MSQPATNVSVGSLVGSIGFPETSVSRIALSKNVNVKTDRVQVGHMHSLRVSELAARGYYSFPAIYRYDKNKFVDKVWFDAPGNTLSLMLSVGDQLRNYNSSPSSPILGFTLTTLANGDDLLMPNGYGGDSRDGHFSDTKVDYGYTYVNPGNGKDVVIGGYGIDFIRSVNYNGPTSFRFDRLKREGSIATGSKFYIGGSDHDLLDGSSDSDYLVGDRFNEYELYLPREALAKNIPTAFEFHKQRIDSYQPSAWIDVTPFGKRKAKGKDRLATKLFYEQKISNPADPGRVVSQTPLWSPGGDIIYGNDGDDTIYGDDNAEGNLALLAQYKSFTLPSIWNHASVHYAFTNTKLTLGNDFIDGGAGNDIIFGGFGSDAIVGGKGCDVINIGDQIVAPDYKPVWGPKVVWGGEYNNTNKRISGTLPEPDVFLIGDVFSTESDILASQNEITDTVTARGNVSTQMTNFKSHWDRYGSAVISSIPGVGDVLANIGNIFVSLFGDNEIVPPPAPISANAVDAITIIKDFDISDQLVIRIPNGGFVKENSPKSYTFNTNGYDKVNPLAKNISGSGRMIAHARRIDQVYDRVFLEGYTGPLYKLSEEYDALNNLVIRYGGSLWENRAMTGTSAL